MAITSKKLIVGFTANDRVKTYTVPAGVTSTVTAYLWGAGGAGGGSDSAIGGNGAAG